MNKMRTTFITAMLLAGIFCPSAHAQNTNAATPDAKMIPGTTTGSSLDNIYTPNLFDGSVNVGIPIYEYTHDQHDFSVFVNFNTKGIQVDEPTTPVGQHWQLNAEPTITRIIKDMPDELNGTYPATFNPTGNQVVDNAEHYIRGKFITYAETQAQQHTLNVYRDGECDEFIVSISGSSFSFYMGADNKIFTVPHRNITVEPLIDGLPVTFSTGTVVGPLCTIPPGSTNQLQFRITDEQGNIYLFVAGDFENMQLDGFADWQQMQYTEQCYPTTRWVISKITQADGSEIRYTHQAYNNPYQVNPYSDYRNYFNRETWPSSPTSNDPIDWIKGQTTYSRSEITGIEYPNDVAVSFVYDPVKKTECFLPMLNEIRISSGDNAVRYKFYRDSVNTRYFLNRISLASDDNTVEEPYYSFRYNAWQLPPRLNSGQDFFGYYNGDSSATPINMGPPFYTLYGDDMNIPQHGSNPVYGNLRGYSAYYAQAGNLSVIKNAYGGELDLSYEANTASGTLSGIYPADNNFVGINAVDGVRVSGIIQKDKYHPSSDVTTRFTYSGGQLFIQGGYFHYPEYVDSATGQFKKVMFQGMFLTAHDLVNGSNHGFSTVDIKSYNGAGTLLSHKKVTFTNMKDATSGNQPRYYKVPGSLDYFSYPYTDKQYLKSWGIGLPLTITEYDQNDHIVASTTNKYNISDADLSAATYISCTKTARVNSGTEGRYAGLTFATGWYPYKKSFTDHYYPFTGTATLSYSIKKKYAADALFSVDTTFYEYDDHNNLSAVTTKNSKNEKITTRFIYNYTVDGPDVPSYYPPHPNSTLYNMTAAGLEKIVSTERWKQGPQLLAYDDVLLDAEINLFSYNNGRLLEKGLLNTAIGSPLSYEAYTGLTQGGTAMSPYRKIDSVYRLIGQSGTIGNFQRTRQVTSEDVKGNPLEVQMLSQNKYDAFFWDTVSGQKTAQADNARQTDIGYTSFEDGFLNTLWVQYGNLIYIPAMIQSTGGTITGKWAFKLLANNNDPITGATDLAPGKTYYFSLWASGAAPKLYIGTTAVTLKTGDSKGSWKRYYATFTPAAAGKIKIATNGTVDEMIDEIRLCPQAASMETWTYQPLFGASSYTAPSGQITYYEYDKLGRQVIARDQDNNIITKTTYTVGQ